MQHNGESVQRVKVIINLPYFYETNNLLSPVPVQCKVHKRPKRKKKKNINVIPAYIMKVRRKIPRERMNF